jgi:hypothetical protein
MWPLGRDWITTFSDSQQKVIINGFPWNDHKGRRIGSVGGYTCKERNSFAHLGHRIADLISGMEYGDETPSFMPISPSLVSYFIRIENKVRGDIADVLNSALKRVNNCFRCNYESVVLLGPT